MTFTCTHCGEEIHGVSSIHDGKIIHHRCAKDYSQAKKIRERWEASGLLEALKNSENKIKLASLYEGKDKQTINE